MAKKTTKYIIDPNYEGNLLDKYTELNTIFPPHTTEEGVILDREKAIRYLALAFDPNSPLQNDYPDSAKRKLQAAKIAQVERKTIPQSYVTSFLKQIVKSMEWTYINALTETFDEESEIIIEKIKRTEETNDEDILKAIEKKGKLWREMKALKEEIKAQKKDFYQDEEETEEKFLFNPQSIAKATKT